MTGQIKSIKTFTDTEKIVLLRVDFNGFLPDGKNDFLRISSTLKTINYLTSLGSKIVILSHNGRPLGKIDEKLSLRPSAKELSDLLGRKFLETDNPIFPNYPIRHLIFYNGDIDKLNKNIIFEKLGAGDILFLENMRFLAEEENEDLKLAQNLANLADIYVNEAFSVSHRKSLTLTVLPKLLPHYGGFQLLSELEVFDKLILSPRKPLVLLLGGAKMTEKENFFSKFIPKCDKVLIGGALANLFLKASGYEVGESLIEDEGILKAKDILRNNKNKIYLPEDVVVSNEMGFNPQVKSINSVNKNERILDVGPKTILKFSKELKIAKTIIWNGPMGLFERSEYAHGTVSLGRLVASRGKKYAYVVVGGGETVQALSLTGLGDSVDFESTGGGAMLSYLAGEKLPGIEVLKN